MQAVKEMQQQQLKGMLALLACMLLTSFLLTKAGNFAFPEAGRCDRQHHIESMAKTWLHVGSGHCT